MTKRDFSAAIDAEAAQWAEFFGVTDADQIEARKAVMRANVAVGYLVPLEPFLELPADNVQPSRFEVVTGTAPSHWASYFINGDDSGMDESEIEQANAFAEWLGGHIVSCEDAGFMHHHDANHFGVGGADCQTYTALIERESVQ